MADGGARPRLVVGITGATGAIMGIRLLEALGDHGVHTFLVMSEWAQRTIRIETDYQVDQVRALATTHYQISNQAAPIASGSFRVDGMVIAPCSMNTLAAIAHGMADNLITRTADVMLKERHRLVLVPRETPLNATHLRNMLTLTEMGAQLLPPVLTFYNMPRTVDDLVRHLVARILDQFGIANELTIRWGSPRLAHTRENTHVNADR